MVARSRAEGKNIMTAYSIAIVGATGLVGSTTLAILEQRNFPVKNLHLLASHQSAGEKRYFRNQEYTVQDLAEFDFRESEICFFSVSNALTAEYAPLAVEHGNIVIDKSSHYRYDKNIPLVIPEVNKSALASYQNKKIIANPNCNVVPIAVALKPIDDAVGILRMNVATYQSVSGTGKNAVEELKNQAVQILANQPVESRVYPQQIAFNVLPHCDAFEENGYTREEMKVVWEMRKIFNNPHLQINPTTVRVPVFYGHSAAVHIETKHKMTAKEAEALLAQAPGVKLISGQYPYPTPIHDAAGKDLVFVGRIREDISHDKGLNFWIVTDNLRKGAALNAVQVAECLVEEYL